MVRPSKQKHQDGLKKALELCKYLDAKEPALSFTKLQILLIVALNKDVLVRDLMEMVGKDQSTISRCIGDLGDNPTHPSALGMNWLKVYPDPRDPRRDLINMGRAGRKELKAMLELFY